MVLLSHCFLLGAGDALSVEGLGDVQGTLALQGHVEDALDHSVGGRVRLQLRTLLGPVLDVDLPIAEGGLRTQEEASRCGLPHPPGNLLRKIFRVKLVHALDDGLHELACRRVVGVLGDGDYPYALASEHGLEGNGVFSLPGEAGEFPDEDFLEWGAGFARVVKHSSELRPVCDPSALGLVDVLAHDHVSFLVCVVAQCPHLRGNRQVDVLPVAGYSGVEGGRCVVFPLLRIHLGVLLLASSRSCSRSFSLSYRMVLSHSRSSM